MDSSMGSTSARYEKSRIKKTDPGIQSDPIAVCEFEVSNSNNASMLSIPECGVVDKKGATADEERGEASDKRKSSEEWRGNQSGDWDNDMISVTSNRSFATCDTAATSESVQSIIQRLNSETDRRRRRLMRRRSKRKSGSSRGREPQEPTSPRGFTVEVVERNF